MLLTRLLLTTAVLLFWTPPSPAAETVDWTAVGGDRGGMRYSKLAEINRENVAQLEVAWTYHTGEPLEKTIECTPIVIDGVMYITTAQLKVVALDAATGKVRWEFDPFAEQGPQAPLASGGVNRGVAWWSDGVPGGARRILHGTADGQLFSIDAETGRLDPNFAAGGIKNLRADIEDRDLTGLPYGPTSAPAICGDAVVVGVSCGEGPGPTAPGDVRALDVRTGRQLWRFHTVPRPGEFGVETWEGDSWQNRGAVNAWGGVSVDVERNLVFCGLGSAAFDFFGGDRIGDNLFAGCTIALDAATGRRVWHFQTLHHDLWDHDLPTYPNLVTIRRDGQVIDAVAQVTKTGYVFVFDRETGRPLFEVEEQPVPASDVPGEVAAATQPVPVRPPPFARQGFSESDVTDIAPENRDNVLAQLARLRHGKASLPPSFQGTVLMPGFHGGATWSGASFDPETNLLYVNSNNVPNIITLDHAPEGAAYPYISKGYPRFRDQEGYPAVKPPWGVVSAIDLAAGKMVWQVPLGEYRTLTERGIPPTGTENFGGTIVTAGGLVFIGGSKDERMHVFDKSTGELLWQATLPAGGYATPCTFRAGGQQFVVIAAGGAGKLQTKPGDAFVAYALPTAE